MKVGIVLTALVLCNVFASSNKNEAVELEMYDNLIKIPMPYPGASENTAWEVYGQEAYDAASKMQNKVYAKELFRRSAVYFEYAGHVSYKKAHDILSKNKKESELYLKKSFQYFSKASESYTKCGDVETANKMKEKLQETNAELTLQNGASDAIFFTPSVGGNLQQQK